MNLIIVSGAEATGKTTIAKTLAKALGYSYHSKDVIKESLFNTQKHSTWDFAWYESMAKNQFFTDIETIARSKNNAIIESNFLGDDKERLRVLLGDSVNLLEIHCYSDGLSSFKRVVKRNESKARHPGHHDRRWYPKIFIQSIFHNLGVNIGAHKPLNLSDNTICVNTTDIANVDYGQLMSIVNK